MDYILQTQFVTTVTTEGTLQKVHSIIIAISEICRKGRVNKIFICCKPINTSGCSLFYLHLLIRLISSKKLRGAGEKLVPVLKVVITITFFWGSHFFWNLFNSEAIKVCCIINIYIQSYAMSLHWFVFIKNYKICRALYLGKLFLK